MSIVKKWKNKIKLKRAKYNITEILPDPTRSINNGTSNTGSINSSNQAGNKQLKQQK